MRYRTLELVTPPQLSDRAACEMLDFLYELIDAFEQQYANQLRQPTPTTPCAIGDLFDEFDDEIP